MGDAGFWEKPDTQVSEDIQSVMEILLVDDHSLFREGMELVLLRLDPTVAARHASRPAEGVAEIRRIPPPALVLCDLNLPGVSGVEMLLMLREANHEVPVVVLAGSEDPALVRLVIEQGAMGYIPKSCEPAEFERALEVILSGGVYLPSVAMSLEPAGRRSGMLASQFTARQIDVLRGLVQGMPNKVIARELGISDSTVKTHVTAVMQILQVHTRTQAVYAVAKYGLALGGDPLR